MKVAKKISNMKVIPSKGFKSKVYPSIVPKLKHETVSKVTKHDEVTKIKDVYRELCEIRNHYLNILSNDNENDAGMESSYYTLIHNILIIERKLIAIKKRRNYEKLKSKTTYRDVDKKMKVMEKMTYEIEELIQDIYSGEQIWSEKIAVLTKKEKKEIFTLAQSNCDNIDQLFKGVSNKWQTYKKVHNAMEVANDRVGLFGKKKITIEMLREIIKQQDQDSSNEELSVS